MRKRLIELLNQVANDVSKFPTDNFIGSLADYLIANGLVVPPCKVGDKIFFVHDMCDENGEEYVEISNGWCVSFSLDGLWMYCRYDGDLTMWHCITNDLGQTVFLNREDAERALKGGGTE